MQLKMRDHTADVKCAQTGSMKRMLKAAPAKLQAARQNAPTSCVALVSATLGAGTAEKRLYASCA
jgi:hypothetical protein